MKKSPWAEKKQYDQLHSICSYLGSFPPNLARYFIDYFTDDGDLVLDPFSGRGTTILECRLANRNSIGSDLNPIALILSKSKSFPLKKNLIMERIEDLEKKFDRNLYYPLADSVDEKIKLIFHSSTIAELCYLKNKLNNIDDEIDTFISATVLGILHGAEKKDGTSSYLSISMPNTFSMSPDYVKKYIQTNNLNRLYRDTFKLLKLKIEKIFSNHISPKMESYIYNCDAKEISSHENISCFKNKVDLVLTSPPYLGIVNYEKQNWIRSWFCKSLGADNRKETNLDDSLNLNEWLTFSKKVVKEIKILMKKKSVAVFVIGDVKKSENTIIPLARDFVNMVNQNKFFKNIWVYSDYINKDTKTTRIWGETKGNATAVDRIVIMSDINPFKSNRRLMNENFITYDEIIESTNLLMGKSFLK